MSKYSRSCQTFSQKCECEASVWGSSDEAVVRDTAAVLSGGVVGALQACRIVNPFTIMLSACPMDSTFGAEGACLALTCCISPTPRTPVDAN